MIKKIGNRNLVRMKRGFFIPLIAIIVVLLAGTNEEKTQDDKSDDITTLTELRRHISRNLSYPREAAEKGESGTVRLYAHVNHRGRIEEVTETKPGRDYIEIDEFTIKCISKEKKDFGKKPNRLINESRRVVMSLPCLDIPQLKGETLKFSFRFVLQ